MSRKLSPPWVIYANKISVLFGRDPEINIVSTLNADAPEVRLYVNNAKKAEAIKSLLPTSVNFGNVILNIYVIPANDSGDDIADTIAVAFSGNPIFKKIVRNTELSEFQGTYVVWAKEVVQFYNDSLASCYGLYSGLPEEIAAQILQCGEEGLVYFCTDKE